MRISKEKEVAMDFLNELVSKGLLESLPSGILSWRLNHTFSRPFHIGSGLYKYVIIIDDYDFVIKTDRRIDTKHGCAGEFDNYKLAVEENMTEFFPETDFLTSIDGHKFYIQERADVDETGVEDSVFEYVSPFFDDENMAKEYVYDDEIAVEDILNAVFPEGKADKLIIWLNEHGIEDIHCGNLGFCHNRPMIIDFSC